MTSAEERAKEIMTWLRSQCLDTICTHLDCPSCGCMAFITSAIRDAENAKLEEAAQICRDMAQKADDEGEDKAMMAVCFCLVDIEKLKKG